MVGLTPGLTRPGGQGRVCESDVPARRDFAAFNDLGITLAVNLRGAPSLTPMDFLKLRQKPRQILGASVRVLAPTGRYDTNRLINVGANCWALRPELGYMIPSTQHWLLEARVGAWFLLTT